MFQVQGRQIWGFQLLQVVTCVSGFYIESSKHYSLLALTINCYGYLLDMFLVITYSYYVSTIHLDLPGLIIFFSSVSCITPILFSIYLKINKRKLSRIVTEIQNMLQQFHLEQILLLRVVSKRCMSYLIITGLLYFGSQYFSIFIFQEIATNSSNRVKGNTTDKRLLDEFLIDTTFASLLFPLTFSALQILKQISQDLLIFTILALITEEIKFLRKQLQILLHEDVPQLSHLTTWVCRQRQWARVFEKFNNLISTFLVLMIIMNVFTVCFVAFCSSKFYEEEHELLLALSNATYSFVLVIQTFMYCHAGDKLRQEGSKIEQAIHRSNWMRAQPAAVPGLVLVAADCKNSFVVRGGHFFTLSLEFFASVMGAVITYLVILIQSI